MLWSFILFWSSVACAVHCLHWTLTIIQANSFWNNLFIFYHWIFSEIFRTHDDPDESAQKREFSKNFNSHRMQIVFEDHSEMSLLLKWYRVEWVCKSTYSKAFLSFVPALLTFEHMNNLHQGFWLGQPLLLH
jgi:hypothetical protein